MVTECCWAGCWATHSWTTCKHILAYTAIHPQVHTSINDNAETCKQIIWQHIRTLRKVSKCVTTPCTLTHTGSCLFGLHNNYTQISEDTLAHKLVQIWCVWESYSPLRAPQRQRQKQKYQSRLEHSILGYQDTPWASARGSLSFSFFLLVASSSVFFLLLFHFYIASLFVVHFVLGFCLSIALFKRVRFWYLLSLFFFFFYLSGLVFSLHRMVTFQF